MKGNTMNYIGSKLSLIDFLESSIENVTGYKSGTPVSYTHLPEKPIPNGYLRLYSKVASSADKGAIIEN